MTQNHMSDPWERRRSTRSQRAKAAARKRRRQKLILPVAGIALLLIVILLLVRCGGGTLPEETDATEESSGVVESSRATITVTGDLLMHKPVINACATSSGYDFTEVFQYISSYVSQADWAVANLETTLAGEDNGYAYSGYPTFNCPDEIVTGAKAAGFDMLLTANNHTYDTGSVGFVRTQQVIREQGLTNLGTTLSAQEKDYLVADINGIRVGMICYTYGQINETTGQVSLNGIPVSQDLTEQINVFDYDRLEQFYSEMAAQIAAMEADGAEAIVLYIHWGTEYQTDTTDLQVAIAQKMCDLGIDVIAGGHPHVVEPVEMLTSTTDPDHRTLCVYSLGNAVSNQRSDNMNLKTGHTEDGMLFTFTFVKYSNGVVALDSAELVPTWVCIRSSDTVYDYNILPLDKSLTDWKTAFSLGDGNLRAAENSWQRTMDLTGTGMEGVATWLETARNDRLEAFARENS